MVQDKQDINIRNNSEELQSQNQDSTEINKSDGPNPSVNDRSPQSQPDGFAKDKTGNEQ